MNLLSLVALGLIGSSKAVIHGSFSKKYVKGMTDCHAFNIILFTVMTILALIAKRNLNLPSAFTLIFGILLGIATMLYQMFYSAAFQAGPVSTSILISSFSLLIPTLAGAAIYHEKINLFQIIGIGLLFISLYFSINPKKGQKFSVKWLALILTCFFIGGNIGLMQKIFRMGEYKNEFNDYLVVAFLCSLLFSVGAYYFNVKVKHEPRLFKLRGNPLLLSIVCGFFSGLYQVLSTYLIGVLDSAVIFPGANGLSILLSTLISAVVIKERLRPIQITGVILGVISILLISNVANTLFKI